jgi:hypothetical protein
MAGNYIRGILRTDLYNKLVLYLIIVILGLIDILVFYFKYIRAK